MSSPAVAPRASRVLLVDPDADTRALYRESLRTIADDIVEAVDARDALAKAFAHPPKAIVTERGRQSVRTDFGCAFPNGRSGPAAL